MVFAAGQKVTAADLNLFGVPVGGIAMWGTATPPTSWLICDGSAFSAATYPALNAVLGGTTLPDMRQRFPLGTAAAGTGSTLLGTGGNIDHFHSADPPDPTTTAPLQAAGTKTTGGNSVDAVAHTHSVVIPAFNTDGKNPPFLAVHFIIRAA